MEHHRNVVDMHFILQAQVGVSIRRDNGHCTESSTSMVAV